MEPLSNYPINKPKTAELDSARSRIARPVTWAATLVPLTLIGCGGPAMMPGSRCGSCHDGSEAPKFGASGTLHASASKGDSDGLERATVTITDAEGRKATLKPVHNGNFYTTTSLTLPLQVRVSKDGVSRSMDHAPSGECNSCHTGESSPGLIHIP